MLPVAFVLKYSAGYSHHFPLPKIRHCFYFTSVTTSSLQMDTLLGKEGAVPDRLYLKQKCLAGKVRHCWRHPCGFRLAARVMSTSLLQLSGVRPLLTVH